MPPRQRVMRRATVTSRERISPCLVRLTFSVPDLVGVDLPHTDHYVKFLFPPAGAPYAMPFDAEQARDQYPDHAPVTRTYSLRQHDTQAGTMTIDFVEHGDVGLAGPWAVTAKEGDQISFFGPGGAWHPDESHDHFVLVGDEAAAPAICAALEAIPEAATAIAFIEVSDAAATFEVPCRAGIDVVWVPRDGAPHGSRLAAAVRAAAPSQPRASWFVHGVAEMIKDLRRFLFVERGLDRADVSISGYWRAGLTEDGWQQSKHSFVESMEQEEAEALAGGAAA